MCSEIAAHMVTRIGRLDGPTTEKMDRMAAEIMPKDFERGGRLEGDELKGWFGETLRIESPGCFDTVTPRFAFACYPLIGPGAKCDVRACPSLCGCCLARQSKSGAVAPL